MRKNRPENRIKNEAWKHRLIKRIHKLLISRTEMNRDLSKVDRSRFFVV